MKRAALLLLALLPACVATGHMPAAALPHGAHYVALGSSFAAGAGISPRKVGPVRCDRSARNYATLLSARLGLDLDDQSCGGAKTAHLLAPWNELPAQLDAVTPETRLVTATIGGNDLGYAGFLLSAACNADGTFGIGRSKAPCISMPLPTAQQYAALETNLRQIARTVKQRAPMARMVFVQYVTLVPDQPCEAARLDPAKASAAREIGRRLAEITARAARLEGAEVLPVDRLSLAHRPCNTQPWSFGTKPVPGEGVFWHPTALGHAEIAKALAERLSR